MMNLNLPLSDLDSITGCFSSFYFSVHSLFSVKAPIVYKYFLFRSIILPLVSFLLLSYMCVGLLLFSLFFLTLLCYLCSIANWCDPFKKITLAKECWRVMVRVVRLHTSITLKPSITWRWSTWIILLVPFFLFQFSFFLF